MPVPTPKFNCGNISMAYKKTYVARFFTKNKTEFYNTSENPDKPRDGNTFLFHIYDDIDRNRGEL